MIKSWKTRYFCLRKDRLIYYADQISKEHDNPIGYIPLKTAESFVEVPRKLGTFQINTIEPQRVWLLKAENDEEMKKWMNACIIHSKYSGRTESLMDIGKTVISKLEKKEGYMDKLGGGVRGRVASLVNQTMRQQTVTWRSRFFVLKDGILFKYESKFDEKPKKVPLYKCVLEEYADPTTGENNRHFKIVTKLKTIVLRADSEEDMQLWLNSILKHKLAIEQIIDDIEEI